ncbi:MAG: AAA family ATPase [Acidobacteriota bacterium]
MKTRKNEIWAVGGGKGGTGKSFVISQIASYLASSGKKVILIDTDFGGANLHSFFGIESRNKTIKDFYKYDEPLESLISKTKIKNLEIIPGDINSTIFDVIKYNKKIRLFSHIKKLNADYILLDLGGGFNKNILDFFLLADKMIVVTIPEITAIENLFQFIKSTFFRKLNFLFGIYGLKDYSKNIWKNRKDHNIVTILDLIDYVKKNAGEVGDIAFKDLSKFKINIILNKVRDSSEIKEGFSLRSICIKLIGINALYSGYLEYDSHFWRNLSMTQLSPEINISLKTKKDIKRVVTNIINNTQIKTEISKNE